MLREFQTTLGRLGLKRNDARVYLACLRMRGGLYVHEIVSETRIHRSTVDLILDRLQGGGYVTRSRVGSRDKYYAQDPEAIVLRQEQALAEFRALAPLVAGMRGQGGSIEVHYFEGADGIRQVYDDVLLQLKKASGERRSIVSFSSGADIVRAYPTLERNFISRRIDMGVTYSAIAPRSSADVKTWISDPASLRTVKYADDKQFPFTTSFDVYADSAMILSTTRPLGGVIIHNRRIADSMRALFQLLWTLLPD